MDRTREEDELIFWSRLNKIPNGCWEWLLSVVNKGYGACWFQNKRWYVHRLAYYLSNGVLPSSQEDVHHKCHNKICCNPEHLELLSKKKHASIDNANSNKTSCHIGHIFDSVNTYHAKNGSRACRKCKAISQRKYTGKYQGGIDNKNKTHCMHGHEFNKQNTYIRSDGNRSCRTCKMLSKKRLKKQYGS